MDCEYFPFNSSSFSDFSKYFKPLTSFGTTSLIDWNVHRYFYKVVYRYTMLDAINDKIYVNYTLSVPTLTFSVSETFGYVNFSNQQLQEITQSILKETGYEKTVVFCNDIATAERLSDEINKMTNTGYSLTITTKMRQGDIKSAINDFMYNDEVIFLINVEMLTSGIDMPHVKNVVILKKIISEDRFQNIISGFLREYPGKEILHVIDYLDNSATWTNQSISFPEQPKPKVTVTIPPISQSRILLRTTALRGVIGVQDIAEELAGIIDMMPNEPGRMIGIFGEWGRGKTFLMDETWKSLARKDNFHKVDFHAWKYQETPAIWAYLYEKIAESYAHTNNPLRKIYRRFKLNFFRLGWQNLLIFLISFAISLFISFGLSPDEKFNIAKSIYLSLGGATIISLITLFFRFKNSARELFRQYYGKVSFTHVLGVQAEVQKELKYLIKSWVGFKDYYLFKCMNKICERKSRKILLFVDDIDRCSDEKIIQLIDSLRVMLDDVQLSRKLVIVTAIDERILKRAIKLKYIPFTQQDIEPLPLDKLVSEYMDKLFITGIKLGHLTPDQKDEMFLSIIGNDQIDFVPTTYDQLHKETPDAYGEENETADTLFDEDFIAAGDERILDEGFQQPTDETIDTQSGASQSPIEGNADPQGSAEDYKLSSRELDILRKKLQLCGKLTPRQLRILYYRYLIAKNLLIRQYNNAGRQNIWFEPEYFELFVELLIGFNKSGSTIIQTQKAEIMHFKADTLNINGITLQLSVSCIDYKILISILDTVIGY